MSNLQSFLAGAEIRTAIILGSGLGGFAEKIDAIKKISYEKIDGFDIGNVSGHAGELILGRVGEKLILLLSGRAHYYENGRADVMRTPIFQLQQCGIKNLIVTNAAGSLNESIKVGEVMQITDHINFSGKNPLIGETSDKRFTSMVGAYDVPLIKHFQKHARKINVTLHSGVYAWFSGPSFETPAEIKAAKILGADAVGMSTVPEVILARFFGLQVAGFSVITNMGAGLSTSELSHAQTKLAAPLGGKILTELFLHTLNEELPNE